MLQLNTMENFGVSPHKTQVLLQKMKDLNILESDIKEDFIRGSGKGGQKVNKTSSCVRLTHQPSDLSVTCQKSREQRLNRYYARCLLVEKMENLILGKKSPANLRLEKIRKQKKKRAKRSQDKLKDESDS